MIGGKKIAEGGYGCVFHPEINCKAKETTNKKFISKLQFLDFSARNEIAIGSYLNSKFNNDKEHPLLNNFAPVVSSCNVDKSKFKKNILNQCKVLQKVSTENDISIIKRIFKSNNDYFYRPIWGLPSISQSVLHQNRKTRRI